MLEDKVVAVVRLKDAGLLRRAVEAIREGGVRCIEITMTVPGALDVISTLGADGSLDIVVGAGTVLGAAAAEAVIEAGARFVVSPVLDEDVIRVCRSKDIFVVPGAFSPTEIVRARSAGADIVKVFPAACLGPGFFTDIKGPFPDILLMPTGGITIENARSFIDQGACCVAIGTALLDKKLIAERRWEDLVQRARYLVESLKR
ncbi:MAG: bifunctional 4-hydroxy-2-oxoglutarate aldolase/2-dehydro-3-deoxy-phosphogluconate aldolase [Candidatus Aminicenantes bacterium]|nr:bifunctional 4-hydroxy-2-oxoglutarate aldolase/2-dehydro-3-deoxy-phosphogluconate aldolase [Candidatus Aminicenantes bacterium]